MTSFTDTIELVGKVMDVAGVAVISLGVLLATLAFLTTVVRGRARAHLAYKSYRQSIGRAILLGLEILVAADIIRTVAVTPTFQSVGVLAIIVAIRTFLSATLELELSGRWPWQQRPEHASPTS
ncbi:MAG: hypothetical protein JWM86_1542 [Thermoleophilia bacterium]|nr:hypothetical protein [Thermoleophilia bacterium]